ncbi:MAG: radical SAM protein [Candidatus Woesearchaeota archaeon]
MVVYALTDKCNLNCIFCSNEDFKTFFSPPDYLPPSLKEIEQWFSSVPRSEENITLTGGEPTLRPDLFEVLDFLSASYQKACITLLTNARRFAYDDYAAKFAKYERLEIEIPIHSHYERVHDALTGFAGSFSQTLKGIQNLTSLGVRTNIRVVINKLNYKELEQMMHFLKSTGGINRVVFINMRIKGRASLNKDALLVKYKESMPYLRKALAFLKGNGIGIQLLHFPFCVIDKGYWSCTLENPYKAKASACASCSVEKRCPGMLDCYLRIVGEKEFVAL